MKQPSKVSIVINNYNYGRFLANAIDSALAQTHSDIEVIVVDDGSTDNSREVIVSYGNRITPVLKPNGGQASALNAGLAASVGDILFFLDSDDVLLPEAAETVIAHFSEGVARISFPLIVIDADAMPLGRLVGDCKIPKATFGPFGVDSPTSGSAFSRVALAKIAPIPEAHWWTCTDAYVYAASSLHGETVYLTRPFGKYRVHGRNNVEGVPSSLAEVRKGIQLDLYLHHDLCLLASERIGPFDQWAGRCPQHWKARITSLRESPDDHPWAETLPYLLLKALFATWKRPYWNVWRKLVYIVLLLAYTVSPRSIRHALVKLENGTRASLLKPSPSRQHV